MEKYVEQVFAIVQNLFYDKSKRMDIQNQEELL